MLKPGLNKIFPLVAVLAAMFSMPLVMAQPSNFNTSKNWALHKKEVYFGIAASQFQGDVGGGPVEGRQKTMLDIDWPSTRFAGHVGFRYRFHPMFATKTHLNVGMIHGDDKYSTEEVRRSRNLHFRSLLVEISQHLEFIIWSNEQVGRRYRIPGLKGFRNKSDQIYVFAGVGLAYYNPKAQYNGSWVALRPLGTEGQNFPDGPKKYSNFTMTIPFGIGFKVGIGRTWKFGMEVTYHKTFTDYIDDVSTVYYDEAALAAQNPMAADIANQTTRPDWFYSGQQRGNVKDKDAFFFTNFTFIKNITYGTKSVGRVSTKWRSVKAKF